MAFVSRSERKLHSFDSDSVGPGAYLTQKEHVSIASYAPFLSTSARNTEQLFGKKYTPGPGTYGVYEVDSSPSAHRKFSVPFGSQNQRFFPVNKESSPGPGNYTVPDQWHKKPNFHVQPSESSRKRIPSAPSIPANHQSNGFESVLKEDLQKRENLANSKGKTDLVGPGSYMIPEVRKNNGPK